MESNTQAVAKTNEIAIKRIAASISIYEKKMADLQKKRTALLEEINQYASKIQQIKKFISQTLDITEPDTNNSIDILREPIKREAEIGYDEVGPSK